VSRPNAVRKGKGKSTSTRKVHRAKRSVNARETKAAADWPDTTAILGQLVDGLAIASTAYVALSRAADGSSVDPPPDLEAIATTLDHGLAMLITAISDADKAFLKLG
jgi:hypothetical protein